MILVIFFCYYWHVGFISNIWFWYLLLKFIKFFPFHYLFFKKIITALGDTKWGQRITLWPWFSLPHLYDKFPNQPSHLSALPHSFYCFFCCVQFCSVPLFLLCWSPVQLAFTFITSFLHIQCQLSRPALPSSVLISIFFSFFIILYSFFIFLLTDLPRECKWDRSLGEFSVH